MNKETLKILEYDKIINRIKDFALTDDARDQIELTKPSTDYTRIYQLLDEVSEAKEILENSTSIPLLGINGIPMLLDKLSKEMVLQPDELEKIKHVLMNTKKFKTFMESHLFLAPTIGNYIYSMYELTDIKEEIGRCIYNNRVDDKASSQLAKVRKQIYIAEAKIKSKLDSMVKSSSIKKYLQDNTVSVKNNRYVLQVKASNKHDVPGVVIEKSATGSTFFIEPSAINRYQEELNRLKMDEENEIYQVLSYLSSLILEYEKEFQVTLDTFITYDVIFAKAKYSKAIEGRSVTLNTDQRINIINGRHPLLGKEAVPLNFNIGDQYSALVITGPNTGGKTVTLKTVGLFTAMVQSGLHIPVDQGSEIAIFGNILADIGDGQSIEQSLSTFSSHITKIIDIVHLANKYTLVILDEIGSGTDPTEGEGLAISILDELYEKNSTIIATSHYGKVKEYATTAKGFINGKMHFDVNTLKPTYQLTIGEAGESNAFVIALRLGLSPNIISKAHEVTYNESKDYDKLSDTSSNKLYISQDTKAKKPKKLDSSVNRQRENRKSKSTNAEDIATHLYDTVDPGKLTIETIDENYDFQLGDQVFVNTFNSKGVIYEVANHKQEVGVLINGKKVKLHKKLVTLKIKANQLYPEGYDFDILFKSKEYRKHDKLMNRKYIKGYSVEVSDKDL